LKEGNYH